MSGPELHPYCPVCGSNDTKEVMIPASDVPEEFVASTNYRCNKCCTTWITGDYVPGWTNKTK